MILLCSRECDLQAKERWGFAPGLCPSTTVGTLRAFNKAGWHVISEEEAGQSDAPDAVLHMTFPNPDLLKRYPRAFHIYCAMEPDIVLSYNSKRGLKKLADIYDAVFTHCDDAVDEENGLYKMYIPFEFDCAFEPITPFGERKLACSITGDKRVISRHELYTQRRRVIDWFEKRHPEDFGFYGTGWSGKYSRYATFGGKVDCKLHTFDRYKFGICFENSNGQRGYVSEKMLDCFLAGIVPVYDGADNIGSYVPKDCFIYYPDYGSPEKLYGKLLSISEREWEGYRERIKAYCRSDAAKRFQPENLAEGIIRAVTSGKRHEVSADDVKRLKSILKNSLNYNKLRAGLPRRIMALMK